MQILAVGCLDFALMGHDVFFVEESPDSVVEYEVRPGGVRALTAALPLVSLTSSIDKFNHGYWLSQPILIGSPAELPKYLGAFRPVSEDTAEQRRAWSRGA